MAYLNWFIEHDAYIPFFICFLAASFLFYQCRSQSNEVDRFRTESVHIDDPVTRIRVFPEDVKNQLIQVMLRKSKDSTFRDGLDEFSGDGFPFNEQSARFLIESNPLPET